MKKVIAQILTVALILGVLAGSVSAVSFGATLSSNKNTVKAGDEIVLTFGVADIDIEGGINSVQGTLEYDRNIFEPVEQDDISPLNGWAPKYNDEDTDLNGDFLAIKLSDGVTKAESVFTVKLKVREGVKDQNTTVSVKNVSTTDGAVMIDTAEKSVLIKIANTQSGNDDETGEDNNQGGNNQGGNNNNNNQGNNNQGNNQGENNNQGTNNNTGNNGANNNNGNNETNKDNTGYNSGNLPKTGTNGNVIIAVGILLAIGIGSLIKYRSMK